MRENGFSLGSDELYGEEGNDGLHGQSGNDKLYGGFDKDMLKGSPFIQAMKVEE